MADNIYTRKAWVDRFIHQEPADGPDEERVRKIVDAMPEDVKMVLDVGLGGGYIYRELRKKNGIRCFGIDVSAGLVARLKAPGACVADAAKLPFGKGRFDLVLAADLLEHIRDEHFEAAIDELKRVSRRYILINSPYKDAIDWPVALCNRCNKEFNVYGHVRVVDMALIRRHFPAKAYDIMVMEVFGRKRDARPATIVHAARRFGKLYSDEGAICPHCYNDSVSIPPRNAVEVFFGKACAATFFLMDTLTPPILKEGSEIRILLRKKYEIQ
jgi:SAM-dependent methyltransferase